MDDAPGQRIIRPENAGRVEDLLGPRRPDNGDQHLHPAIGIADAELRCRDSEFRSFACNTQVTAKCRRHAAADARALYHGEGRQPAISDRVIGKLGILAKSAIIARLLQPGLEFGNVRARHEGLAARASEDHDLHVRIVLESLQDDRNGFPHLLRDRIAAVRIVEDQPAGPAIGDPHQLVQRTFNPPPFRHYPFAHHIVSG